MTERGSIIHSDPQILGGTPVFVGTRVPAQALIDYLEGGHPWMNFSIIFPRLRVSKRSPLSKSRATLCCTTPPTKPSPRKYPAR
jgi:hypothetical protein